MTWVRPYVQFPGSVVRVRRPQGNDQTRCHCSLNVTALLGGNEEDAATLPISKCQMHEIQMQLPQRLHTCTWNVIFDTAKDGFSLTHFYRNVGESQDAGICLLTVAPRGSTDLQNRQSTTPPPGSPLQRDISSFQALSGSPTATTSSASSCVFGLDGAGQQPHRRSVIGCFASELPNLRHNPHHFYGSRETFVFRFSSENGGIVSHKWCGSENEEFLISSLHFLGVGGGRDGAAIFLDEELQFGTSSAHCATFDCPSLFGRPREGLHHSEFVILRMMWFSLQSPRFASTGGSALRPGLPLLSKCYADVHDVAASACSCGRCPHSHNCSS